MLRLHPLHSYDAPELAPYRTMKLQLDHKREGIFVAEGEKVVRRLLASRLEVVSVVMPQKWLADYTRLIDERAETIDVFVVEKDELETLTRHSMYQGVLAVGKLPASMPLARALADSPSPRLFVAMDAINNSENVGSLVRNCAALGTHALLTGETCSSPYLRRAVRGSMGTIFELPVVECASLAETLANLRQKGVHCIAAHPHTDRRMVWEADFTGDCCVVFGSEGFGISPQVLAACDEALAIPMRPGVDSLNVASAAAAFLSEAQRQRRSTR